MSRRVSSLLVAAFVIAEGVVLAPCNAIADTIVLETGGRIEGKLVNDQESPRRSYIVLTASGGRVTLARSQVKEIIRQTPAEREYERIRPRYPDSVDGHWELALWCRDHRLDRLRDKHLQRIVELEPTHNEAHRLLGHKWDEFQKRWKTEQAYWKDQGYVFYRGDWITPQEREFKQRARKNELAVKQWKRELKLLRGWLATDRRAEALKKLSEIDDPYAVAALAECTAHETDASVRRLYVEALGRIGAPAAWPVLAELSLHDDNEEVRLTCLDYLDDDPSPHVDFYVKNLKHPNNKIVNNAAIALKRLGVRRAIGPLIGALITVHKQVIPPGSSGNINPVFGSGGGAFNFGDAPAKIVDAPSKNPAVLESLVHLAGGPNFDYDVERWKAWFAAQRKTQSLNLRRD